MSRKSLPDLIIAIDFGGSATKILASTSTDVYALCMEPEVIEVDKQLLDDYESTKLGQADEKNRAWVGYDNLYYAVGYLAQYKFAGTPGLSELKYERAIPKALAAVWVAARHFSLGRKFNVAIACVLPPGEYADAASVETLLREALASYETPTGQLALRLTHFNCKPEGGATYMMIAKNQRDELLQKVVAVIMVGYRNASILISNRGEVGSFLSSDLGFIQLVSAVMQKTSGQTAELLTPSIFEAGEKLESKPLFRLIRSTNEQRQSEELEQIRKAVASSRKEYFLKLSNWMKEHLPREVDEVVLCGGTVDYLATEFKSHFQWTPIQWHGGVTVPTELDELGFGNRLVDVYCLFVYFRKSVLKMSDLTETALSIS
ncbi:MULTISPECIES: ParM/StbA family protein [unclassified Coleofasciculus]|uniref:ParM/StbA family protein n=1 Tax=unclassified Coleofasciculus TaxID=2692782 RepID=UPI00188000FA|nr:MULTISPECIES: ParM/StbA family protein [unclassified Coleofasciculus]MBE9128027.1 ParM/StbA family protein [Coleofasciculus sp. LEGE 07081]MBE9150533.1 ParM/StbA family protein [Coleofasciculus sp. LEGE 07092]